MNKIAKRIGFLVTGSELTAGEILNSNSPNIASVMQEFGMNIGEHVLCDDQENNIKASLEFLLTRHDAVITIGGLGPTSDDITRTVVADVAQRKLVFNEASWQKIVDRLSKYKLSIPENNRQQAFFPEGATVLANQNGTADGCMVPLPHNKTVFMLPGPPHECLTLFKTELLPYLQKNGFESPLRLFRWRLLGVSESSIAEQITPIGAEFNLEFAYRVHYPFTDIKLMLDPHSKNHSKVLTQVERTVKPYFASHLNLLLTQQLQEFLQDNPKTFSIEDTATKGYFLQKISTPEIEHLFLPQNEKRVDFQVSLQGLGQFWSQAPDGTPDTFTLDIIYQNQNYHFENNILIRRKNYNILDFVAEFSALKILNLI